MRHVLSLIFQATLTCATLVLPDLPPRGLNTFDHYPFDELNETLVMQLADAMALQLSASGYEYLVIDGGWADSKWPNGTRYTHLDKYGRPIAAPERYPSGMQWLGDQVRSRGLKFGLWTIRGVHTEAVRLRAPILDAPGYTANQLVDELPVGHGANGSCLWAPEYLGVNMSHPAAQTFYDSHVALFVEEYEVDFIKADCFMCGPCYTDEVMAFTDAVRRAPRSLVLSYGQWVAGQRDGQWVAGQREAPETGTGDMGPSKAPLGSMYRVVTDFHGGWYEWGGLQQAIFILGNFSVAAKLAGANNTWPDPDMLPMSDDWWGRSTEQDDRGQTIATLWHISKAPLMHAGALPANERTLSYLTNKDALRIHSEGDGRRLNVSYVGNCTCVGGDGSCTIPHDVFPASPCVAIWTSALSTGGVAAAAVNAGENTTSIVLHLAEIHALDASASYEVKDVWAAKALGKFSALTGKLTLPLRPHASQLLLLSKAPAATLPWPSAWGVNSSAAPGGVLGGCSGHLFGFSGLDGNTSERADFVAVVETVVAAAPPISFALRFCGLSTSSTLTISMPGPISNITTATNDVLQLAAGDAQLSMAWASGSLLAGVVPPNSRLALTDSDAYTGDAAPPGVTCRIAGQTLALCTSPTTLGMPWGLALDSDADAAVRTAATAACTRAPCSFSLDETIEARLAPYAQSAAIAAHIRPEFLPVAGKALSVMRVNALSPEGLIVQRWSTPDRMPHQWMWLWDSAYHSLAANHMTLGTAGELAGRGKAAFGHVLGWEYLASVLDGADATGAIAIERTPDSVGEKVSETQPPLLAWAVYENFAQAKADGDEATALGRLQWALPRLERYLQWDFSNRADPSGSTPLLCWKKGTESGMDNSQRFDDGRGRQMLTVDFSVFAARESDFLAKMHTALGNATAAATWRAIAAKLGDAIHSELWDASRGMYVDKVDGAFSPIVAVTGLLPLWLPDLPPDRLPPLLSALADPARFNTSIPLPSVARDTPTFSTDMWRGPMWLNTNYHVILALLSRSPSECKSCAAIAHHLLRTTLVHVQTQYQRHGVLFEFYDADGAADPRTLLRKGTHSGGVRDYHWTAALVFVMAALEGEARA